jgi:hypothetical protein
MTQFLNPPFTTGTLTAIPRDPILDLVPWVGQRISSFRFARSNGVTGEQLDDVNPIRTGTLTHDTTRTIKRQLSLSFGKDDAAMLEPLTDRITVYMVMGDGTEYPLGRSMFTDDRRQVWTSGELASTVLSDEMFLVDQQIQQGVGGVGGAVINTIYDVLAGLPITVNAEASPFDSNEAWTVGTNRGAILEALSVTGDYFSPWFDNDGVLRFIRSFNAADSVVDFDFDSGNKVVRGSITAASNILTAPNRFIVISNAADDSSVPAVGIADVPPSAPYSFAQRGFYIVQTQDLQVPDSITAAAIAQNLANRQTVFLETALSSAPDPRHDSYNVIQWLGEKWLEVAWSMPLTPGGPMTHSLRRAYG